MTKNCFKIQGKATLYSVSQYIDNAKASVLGIRSDMVLNLDTDPGAGEFCPGTELVTDRILLYKYLITVLNLAK